jgi:hypothetical protein
LSIPRETFTFDGSDLEEYPCDSFGYDWVADWKDTYDGVTKYREATYLHQYPNSYTVYPGAAVYYGTGTNRLTYLGACNGDSEDNLLMEVHRWAVSKVIDTNPPTVVWDWVKIHEVSIQGYYKYTFYSGHPNGRYRSRVQGEGGSVVEHFGVGAAWTGSFPLTVVSPD